MEVSARTARMGLRNPPGGRTGLGCTPDQVRTAIRSLHGAANLGLADTTMPPAPTRTRIVHIDRAAAFKRRHDQSPRLGTSDDSEHRQHRWSKSVALLYLAITDGGRVGMFEPEYLVKFAHEPGRGSAHLPDRTGCR